MIAVRRFDPLPMEKRSMKLENELREVMRAATAVLDGSRGISKDVLAVNADRMRWLEEAVRNAQIADADSAGEKHVATD